MLIISRWGRYLVERFALPFFIPSAFLHTLFLVHYTAGVHSWIDWRIILIGSLTYVGVFLILRLADELKDKSHDDEYYPNRPVQRGLIALSEVRRALAAVIILVVLINLTVYSWQTFAVLVIVSVYMTLMRYEFFISGILRPRILLYLVTHQLFVPIFFCYYFTLMGRLPTTIHDALFLLANLGMLMSVEVARKIRSASDENASRDTYSAALGRGRSVVFLLGLLFATTALLVYLKLSPVWIWWLVLIPAVVGGWYYFSDRRRATQLLMGTSTILVAMWMILVL